MEKALPKLQAKYDKAIVREKDLLEKHGLPDESTLAMVVPHNIVRLTSQ